MSTGLAAPPPPGVAPWCSAEDVEAALPTLTGSTATLEGVDLDTVIQAATDILYPLSGRQWRGVHRSQVRPAKLSASCGCLPYPYGGIGYGTTWGIGFWGGYSGFGGPLASGWGCGCPARNELVLQGPVLAIESVIVDGSLLTAGADYQLLDRRRLMRVNGTWNCCQRLDLPTTEANTWGVIYDWGTPPPAAGRLAATEMACQIALALSQNAACRLPGRVTSVAREGVTAIVQDPLLFVEKSLTGLPMVDQFLMAFNPHNLRRRARVVSPDTMRRHTY